MPPGFFYFTQTNYVRSFAACCNRRCSVRASWLWSDRIKTSQKKRFHLWRWSWSVPTEIVACSRRSYSGVRREGRERERNKKEGKREREKGTPTSLVLSPTSPRRCLFFFFAHISLRCPHDLNAWNRLRNCGKKRLSCFHRISIHNNVIPKYLDNALTDFA